MPHALRDQAGRDVDAVQDVADVVQDVGRDLGHAGFARGGHEFLVHALEFHFLAFALGRVLNHRDGAQVWPSGPINRRALDKVVRGAPSWGMTMSSRLLMVSPRSARAKGPSLAGTGVAPSMR